LFDIIAILSYKLQTVKYIGENAQIMCIQLHIISAYIVATITHHKRIYCGYNYAS